MLSGNHLVYTVSFLCRLIVSAIFFFFRTDFYRIMTPEQTKMGFAPGVAEKMTLQVNDINNQSTECITRHLRLMKVGCLSLKRFSPVL